MRCHHLATTLAAATLCAAAAPAVAGPLFGGDDLQRNGAMSRHLWTADAAATHVGGYRLAAGVAVGLRDPLAPTLGRTAAPTLTLRLDPAASVSLLPARDGAALVMVHALP